MQSRFKAFGLSVLFYISIFFKEPPCAQCSGIRGIRLLKNSLRVSRPQRVKQNAFDNTSTNSECKDKILVLIASASASRAAKTLASLCLYSMNRAFAAQKVWK